MAYRTRISRSVLLAGVGVAVVCIALVRTFSHPSIRMDGIGFYAPLASLVFDRDLDLTNEIDYADNYNRRTWYTLPDGRVVNPKPVGPAILWAPAVLVARALDPAGPRYADKNRWRGSSPGYQRRYVQAIAVGTGLEALLAGLLLFRCLRRFAGSAAAWAGVAAAALGTPLVYYALAEPSYGHAASFLACAALLALAISPARGPGMLVGLGALWGLASLVRYQDAVLGIIAAPRLLEELGAGRRRAIVTIVGRMGLFLIPAVLVFLPQILFWHRSYGQMLFTAVPPDMRWARPAVLPFLFSTWQGAFVWSPLLLVGLTGLWWVPDRRLRWALLAAVAFEIYASAAVGDWWGSASFGARRLVVIAPLAGLGVALWVERLASHATRSRLRLALTLGIVTLGVLWNLRLAQYNLAGFIPLNTGNYREYWRSYSLDDPRARPYGFWDHGRLLREFADAERRMWSAPAR